MSNWFTRVSMNLSIGFGLLITAGILWAFDLGGTIGGFLKPIIMFFGFIFILLVIVDVITIDVTLCEESDKT